MTNLMQQASRLALVVTLSATPVVLAAQTDTTKPVEESATADTTAQDTVTDTVATDAPVEAEATQEVAVEEMPKPVEGQIKMQSENTILAEDLIGSSVYSANGESIGDVEDLIINLDGKVEGVVIGVGGFLGIGEKWVALEMASLSTMTDESERLRLVTSATKVDLEAAEAFITASEIAAAKRSLETIPPEDTTAETPDPTASN